MNRDGLTSITIENFKGISEPVTVLLRPITLLFGANSAGKSTVIQALQYAWELLENKNPDVDRTRLGGESIDLGGFRNLVHQHDLGRSISITLGFAGGLRHRAYMSPELYFSSLQGETAIADGGPVDVTDWLDIQEFTVRVTSAWDMAENRAFISAYEVSFDGALFGRIEGNPGQKPELFINADHPCLSETAIEGYSEPGREVMRAILDHFADPIDRLIQQVKRMTPNEIEELKRHIEESLISVAEGRQQPTDDLFNEGQDKEWDSRPDDVGPHFLLDSVIPDWGSFLSVTKMGNERLAERIPLQDEVVWVLSQLLLGAGESVLDALRGLRYLGPLRAIPDRSFLAPLQPQQSRWANGLGAWDALFRASPKDELVETCNEYLSETLNLGYTMSKVERIQVDANSDILSALQLFVSRYEEYDGDDLNKRVLGPLNKLPRVPFIQLHDDKNDVDVEPMDIGVGVSQTLPVVVGAVEPNCTIFAVEQPELHIHPAVQVNLADVFLREGLEEGKTPRIFLLETHSEHIVLRIMRRMRETCEGRLISDFPPVTPDDVAVLYVETVDARTCVREMPLNERGELLKSWPGGFFEEALRETF